MPTERIYKVDLKELDRQIKVYRANRRLNKLEALKELFWHHNHYYIIQQKKAISMDIKDRLESNGLETDLFCSL